MPRKKPFSGKQKKQQLHDKRIKKGSSDHPPQVQTWQPSSSDKPTEPHSSHSLPEAKEHTKGVYDPSRFHLNFLKESREELERRKKDAQSLPVIFVDERELEADIKDVYRPGSVLDVPKRPTWKYTMSKQQVERKEEAYFKSYLMNIYEEFGEQNLSYFEHNLETWRQAWRVWEMSDVIVMVTDVRHPILHFSPALYEYVTKELNKPLILVLNKIDLVPANVIAAWTSYFKELFPELHVVWFTSFPQDVRSVDLANKKSKRTRKKRVYNTQIGPKELLQICKNIVGDKVDLSSWATKIESDLQQLGFHGNEDSTNHHAAAGDSNRVLPQKVSSNEKVDKTTQDEILTIGFVGHPNVGKSSLMNGLIGRKVVSTSVTPGHTKYFQTYFLTKTVKLCDSPGLVFPSLIHKQLQILSGIYPIAQVQEPYTPVGYLASRIPLVDILQLKRVENPRYRDQWTPWEISEAWAEKRNYRTAKAARPDVYRAANSILRMAVDGRLCLYMRPPGFTHNKDYWEQHENTVGLLALQSTGHFHGNGRPLPLRVEDLYSSESICDSNSEVWSSNEEDDTLEEDSNILMAVSKQDSESDNSDSDHDVTISPMTNQFSLLASGDFDSD
uniref:guanine nucleotide-binding protein-like 1 n=1 Tax=Ciona intestinalis TaxID=7719 RepID=UPI000180C418|nr:guanine nucleotide-binding protein-like 1 [Ciona intestinalis]|eukprot:XP_002128534.1 guanine nucleotide-binding protein-like 1 [Ciona intestinalis]